MIPVSCALKHLKLCKKQQTLCGVQNNTCIRGWSDLTFLCHQGFPGFFSSEFFYFSIENGKRQIVVNLSRCGKMEETHKGDGIMANELACLNCGKGFTPTCHITRQKFCSSECRVRYNNAKRYYTDTPVNECPECGTPIKQSGEAGRWRRFCGKRCRQLYHYKKWQEKREANYQPPVQICPNCGKDFQPEWGPGTQRRFCGDACRTQWWTDYQKANPSLEEKPLWCECCGQALRMDQKKYCSRACYLRAMEETHRQQVCAWCGEEFSVYAGEERQYCCRNCANAAKTAPKNFQKGCRSLRNTEPESWAAHIKQAAREAELSRDSKRVRLVCGETSMYAGIDSLTAIVRYRFRFNPYDGSIYVFRDQSGTMLKYLHWDGQSFCHGKRRAQSGTYPWPDAPEGEIVEITEREFQYLLSRSIAPTKDRKQT